MLTLLLGGLSLGLSRSPKKQFEILGEMAGELSGLRKANLKRTIRLLYGKGILKEEKQLDGTVSIVLSEKGKVQARNFNLENVTISKPRKWDGYWRILVFDVPESLKKLRNTLRFHFKRLGFIEYQKSVFVHPYSCAEEVDQIVKFLGARKYVRQILATSLDDEGRFAVRFDLS